MEPGPTASKKETITPSSTIPYLKAIQISARSEPISPSYDPNEFVHFYKKKSHKKIMIFIKNRCAQVMTNLIAPFMEELRTRRDLANNSDTKLKIQRKFAKKIRLKIAISRAGTSAASS